MNPSPFELLGVEPRFDLDIEALEERHRLLSGTLHPDRYAGKPPAERRMALDKAIQVNEAWRALRDPVRRAEALLSVRGLWVDEDKEPKPPPALLMEMMEIREELAEAKQSGDLGRIGLLGDKMRGREKEVLARLNDAFDQNDNDALLPSLGELRYIRRFFEELDAIEDALLD